MQLWQNLILKLFKTISIFTYNRKKLLHFLLYHQFRHCCRRVIWIIRKCQCFLSFMNEGMKKYASLLHNFLLLCQYWLTRVPYMEHVTVYVWKWWISCSKFSDASSLYAFINDFLGFTVSWPLSKFWKSKIEKKLQLQPTLYLCRKYWA